MTSARSMLCAALCACTLALGLATAVVQSQNHERGLELNELKERCSMLEAINGDQAARIRELDTAPPCGDPIAPNQPAPKSRATPANAQAIASVGAQPIPTNAQSIAAAGGKPTPASAQSLAIASGQPTPTSAQSIAAVVAKPRPKGAVQ